MRSHSLPTQDEALDWLTCKIRAISKLRKKKTFHSGLYLSVKAYRTGRIFLKDNKSLMS